jgi:hypothetical protein
MLATLLALLAVTASPAFAITSSPPAPVSGQSPYVHCSEALPNGAYADVEVEPRLAVNPLNAANLIGVWIQDNELGDVAAASTDGGSTWTEEPLPFSACAPGGLQFGQALDPWVSVGPDGTAYATGLAVTFSAAGQTASAVVAATSSDGGRTWSNARVIRGLADSAGLQQINDKPTVVADPTRRGTAYAMWQQDHPDGSAPPSGWFSRTTNGGRSWSKPTDVVPSVKGSGNYFHELVADPVSHDLYDVFNLVRPHLTYRKVCAKVSGSQKKTCRKVGTPVPGKFDGFIAFVRSADRGATWTKPAVIADDLSLGIAFTPGGLLTVGPGIDATVDPRTGELYVVWTDGRFSGLRYDQVVISSSGDKGKRWTSPQPASSAATSFDPTVAVDSDGIVGVTYYDLRDATSDPSTIPVAYWLTASYDKGRSFTAEVRLGAFDMKTAPDIQGYFVGDYEGLVAIGRTFRPFFVMTTGVVSNSTDVYIEAAVP